MYKLQNSNHQIQWETILQGLFKHFIQERQVEDEDVKILKDT